MTLCDAGPLVALIDAGDPYHAQCVEATEQLRPLAMLTTTPCLTEAMYLLHRAGGQIAQNGLWSLIATGTLRLYLPRDDEWRRISELNATYADLPLDMADASLISAGEQLGLRSLLSIDRAMRVVRLRDDSFFEVLP